MVIIGPLIDPEVGLVKKLENVTMKINHYQMNAGILYVTEDYLRWQETGRHEGISIAWQDITLHAISNNPVKCIYLMMDQRCDYPPEAIAANGNGNGNGRLSIEDDDEGTCEDEEPEMTEIWFVPTDENTIENIFDAMKQCQSLHPDPEQFSEEEEELEDFRMAEDDGAEDIGNLHIEDDDRFADAE